MNTKVLTNDEFNHLHRLLHNYFSGKIPRAVNAALFIEIVDDPDYRGFRLERQIARGEIRIAGILAKKDPDLYQRLFHR